MKGRFVALSAVALALVLTGCCGPRCTPTDVGSWGYVGGEAVDRGKHEVAGTENDALYLTERYGLSAYRIQLPNGTYTVGLHFAETYERIDAAGQRTYTVSIEGKPVLEKFDPFKEAGNKGFAAIVKTFKANVTDGELTIEFTEGVQNPMINGICVCVRKCPIFGGKKPILKINCGSDKDLACPKGCTWAKDQPFVAKK